MFCFLRIPHVAMTLALCAVGTGAAAQTDMISLACLTKNPSSRDWVPEGIFVRLNPQTLKAGVTDEFTLRVHNGPAIADVEMPTSSRVKLTWKLVGIRDRTNKVQNVRFTMSINTQRGTFNYSGIGESFFVTPGTASGRCVVAKDDS
jgi:hypothetical protein